MSSGAAAVLATRGQLNRFALGSGHHPYSLPENSVARNKMRTAAIWMDEYAFIVKAALGSQGQQDVGSIEHMMQLRRDLKCKPFSWFMKEVYPVRSVD
jgi:polypeptide N-acetylgalactosaminyltransferase